jgi:hypothetical protein
MDASYLDSCFRYLPHASPSYARKTIERILDLRLPSHLLSSFFFF